MNRFHCFIERMSTAATEPFLPGSIPFVEYLEQLHWVFKANEYSDEKYMTKFLAVCGREVYSDLKKLFPGQDFEQLNYKQITEALMKHYDKTDSDVIHSFRFWTRKQGRNETSEEFVLNVKVLAEFCVSSAVSI